MNGILQIIVCAVLTFVVSAVISLCLSKIKYVKVIVGG